MKRYCRFMDKLDSAITALRLEIDADEKHLAGKKVRLAALVDAAEMRPATARTHTMKATDIDAVTHARTLAPRASGRARGSISREWRVFLADYAAAGNEPMPRSDFIGKSADHFNISPASARTRMRQYIDQGHLDERAGLVSVSEAAIERFRLTRKGEGHTVSGAAPNGSGVQPPENGV